MKNVLIVSDSREWLTVATFVYDYSLLPHDARILATALEYNCDKLATLDEDFGTVKDIIKLSRRSSGRGVKSSFLLEIQRELQSLREENERFRKEMEELASLKCSSLKSSRD